MSNPNSLTDTNNAIEASLKDLLDKILNYYEKFILTKEDLAALENKLNDYENVAELIEITKNVFASLTETLDQKLQSANDDNYGELEKIVQKHESEIRNHIRIEQQIKLYAESIQAKLDESEKTRLDLLEQTKVIINNVKRDNQKLTETLKQKTDENEQLTTMIKNLEETNKEYKQKLQELPQLQERINSLEKKTKITSTKAVITLQKDISQNSYDIENAKKSSVDLDASKINIRPESGHKATGIKAVGSSHYSSPLKFINRTSSNGANQIHQQIKTTKEYIRIKADVSEAKHRKELDALKNSYQKFYNPNKAPLKEREREREKERHSTSLNKTRELKQIYSIPLVSNYSNSSLIQVNQNLSHRDHMLTKLHQRSNSHGANKNKSRSSFVKLEENGNL